MHVHTEVMVSLHALKVGEVDGGLKGGSLALAAPLFLVLPVPVGDVFDVADFDVIEELLHESGLSLGLALKHGVDDLELQFGNLLLAFIADSPSGFFGHVKGKAVVGLAFRVEDHFPLLSSGNTRS